MDSRTLKAKMISIFGKLRSYIIYDLLYPFRKRKFKIFFEDRISTWQLIFDIGGHLGDRTRYFRDFDVQIVVVEPHPYYFDKLRDRFSEDTNVILLNKGISDSNEILNFFPSPSHPSVSTFNAEMKNTIINQPKWQSVKWSDPIRIEVVTLQHLIDTYGIPDFVKIDVEGLEYEVISTLEQPLNLISFEFLPAYPEPALKTLEFLNKLGNYQFQFVERDNYKDDDKWIEFGTLHSFLLDNQGPSGNILAKLRENVI